MRSLVDVACSGGGAPCLRWTRSVEEIPATGGAYLLLLRLDRPAELPPRFDPRCLGEGSYVYVGSARGPGGLRARCARHLHNARTCHWQIDWLLAGTADRRIMAFPGWRECELLTQLLRIEGASVPLPGFGSTDCRRCPSHLLALPAASLSALPDYLTGGWTRVVRGNALWRC